MIFARYIGTDKQFTPGKVYPAIPEVESGDTANFGFIELRNDESKKVRIHPAVSEFGEKRYDFEFLEEVYAVVVKPFEGCHVGQVVTVDNAQLFEGEKSKTDNWHKIVYSIQGIGFHSTEYLVLLDRTNVFPGMMLLDRDTRYWVAIKSVDECLWVVTENNPERRSPEKFVFSVDVEGDIQVEPLVKCVDYAGVGHLGIKNENFYRVLREELTNNGKMLWVVTDTGLEVPCFASRFR